MVNSIMIVGVGGQGTLLASRILGDVCIKKGCDVKISEVHGMSQRGGSVVTYVRYGEKVYSPLIDKGGADIILAFETLEAYRYISYLKPDGKIICSTQEINPMPVIIGKCKYPENILDKIQKLAKIESIDAVKLALNAGNIKCANVVLIGLLAKNTDIPYEEWINSIKDIVPQKLTEVNLKAFELGYKS